MIIQQFKTKLKVSPTEINFAETMQVIEDNYTFTPTTFTNGNIKNNAGENSGSCKLFAFAKLQKLQKRRNLILFWRAL